MSAVNYQNVDNIIVTSGNTYTYGIPAVTVTSGTSFSGTEMPVLVRLEFFDTEAINRDSLKNLFDIVDLGFSLT